MSMLSAQCDRLRSAADGIEALRERCHESLGIEHNPLCNTFSSDMYDYVKEACNSALDAELQEARRGKRGDA